MDYYGPIDGPLPVYKTGFCRMVAMNIHQDRKCPYCRENETQHLPLMIGDLGVCCLDCYKLFRKKYYEYLTISGREDSWEQRNQFVAIFKIKNITNKL